MVDASRIQVLPCDINDDCLTESRMTTSRLLITLCTYNELENLPKLIPEIHAVMPDADVLVIDDNSPDGTGQAADKLAASDVRIKVLHRAGKLGLGTATVAGFRFAIEHGYDQVLNMDADFSHHPRHLVAIRNCLSRVDVAIGSRYVPGGGVVGWNWWRRFMSRSINVYARLFLGLRTQDNSGSFRCYRIPKLAEIEWSRIRARGYAFQEELLYRCRAVGCSFEETPIVFENRCFGISKINWKEAVAALWVIFRLGLDRLCGTPVRTKSKTDVA